MESIQNILCQALIDLLRPIVRLALHRSLRVQDFEEAMKMAFLEVAREEIEHMRETVTLSKLSAMTGLQRRDIRRLSDRDALPRRGTDLITRVVGLWQSASLFQDRVGRPRELSFKNGKGEFTELVLKVSSDLNPYTVLFELQRSGMARQSVQGVQLLRPAYQPTGDVESGLRLLSQDSCDLHRIVEYNLFTNPKDPHLHIKTEYDNIPISKSDLVKNWIMKKGALFHEEARRFLAKLDRDINPNSKAKNAKEESIRAIVGSFGFVDKND